MPSVRNFFQAGSIFVSNLSFVIKTILDHRIPKFYTIWFEKMANSLVGTSKMMYMWIVHHLICVFLLLWFHVVCTTALCWTALWGEGIVPESNIGYPSENHLRLKSPEVSFIHITYLRGQIILIFGTEHGSITAMLCAKYRNDWATGKQVMGKQVFIRFEFWQYFLHCSNQQNWDRCWGIGWSCCWTHILHFHFVCKNLSIKSLCNVTNVFVLCCHSMTH